MKDRVIENISSAFEKYQFHYALILNSNGYRVELGDINKSEYNSLHYLFSLKNDNFKFVYEYLHNQELLPTINSQGNTNSIWFLPNKDWVIIMQKDYTDFMDCINESIKLDELLKKYLN